MIFNFRRAFANNRNVERERERAGSKVSYSKSCDTQSTYYYSYRGAGAAEYQFLCDETLKCHNAENSCKSPFGVDRGPCANCCILTMTSYEYAHAIESNKS